MKIRKDGKETNKYIDLNARRCKETDFGLALDYFLTIPYLSDLYCIDNYDIAHVINTVTFI